MFPMGFDPGALPKNFLGNKQTFKTSLPKNFLGNKQTFKTSLPKNIHF
jgi:hypothetical protein